MTIDYMYPNITTCIYNIRNHLCRSFGFHTRLIFRFLRYRAKGTTAYFQCALGYVFSSTDASVTAISAVRRKCRSRVVAGDEQYYWAASYVLDPSDSSTEILVPFSCEASVCPAITPADFDVTGSPTPVIKGYTNLRPGSFIRIKMTMCNL
jgi:hypothetical protein